MQTPSGEPRQVKVAYLCSLYPAISHTFIAREVDALRRLGAEIATFSIHRAGAEHLLGDDDRAAFDSTFAILPASWTSLLAAHLSAIAAGPSAYVSTLLLALRLAPRGARGILWQLFYFVEAVVLWKQCRRRETRHIHAHLANVAADVALLTAALGTAIEREQPWSWSFTMHGPTEFFDVGHFRLALKLRHARFAICISDFARSQLIAVSDDADASRKLHVVHCGVPLDRFTRVSDADSAGSARRDGKADLDPTILYVGRLVPEKGQGVLLHALARLRARGRPVRATLVGAGPERESLEALARRLGVAAHVRFTGALGQEQILALYEDAALFCLPSFAEGVPCVLMEAMAMELPVLSTFVAGIPELVEDGVSGLLVAPGRPDLLALALERLLADPALCRELARAGRKKVVEEFAIERSAEQLYAIFAAELLPAPALAAGAGAAAGVGPA
jgi:colanic acid/amylovoran biosynthesis glycosyltransferase